MLSTNSIKILSNLDYKIKNKNFINFIYNEIQKHNKIKVRNNIFYNKDIINDYIPTTIKNYIEKTNL